VICILRYFMQPTHSRDEGEESSKSVRGDHCRFVCWFEEVEATDDAEGACQRKESRVKGRRGGEMSRCRGGWGASGCCEVLGSVLKSE
jgi:hypothetical protein